MVATYEIYIILTLISYTIIITVGNLLNYSMVATFEIYIILILIIYTIIIIVGNLFLKCFKSFVYVLYSCCLQLLNMTVHGYHTKHVNNITINLKNIHCTNN